MDGAGGGAEDDPHVVTLHLALLVVVVLCADAAAASARATELIVYLLSPLPTPRTPQPGLSSIHDHNRHHLRFYREKSFGHQMVACMTRITLKLNKRKRKLDWVDIYSFMMQQSVPSHKISSLLK